MHEKLRIVQALLIAVFSSLGFIEFVVLPAFDICSEMSDILLETKTSQVAGELGLEGTGGKERAWVAPIADNKRRWKEQCKSSSRGKRLLLLLFM